MTTHAAELSGSSMEEIGKVAQRTSRAVNDALNGISNAGTRAFEQVGVALRNTDGTARDVESILGDVAEQFANMPDGAQKTALAIEMFGRSGANLIPLLNQGRDGLKEMGDEAERLGLVFDERTGRASEQFNDNMLRLSRTMTGLWNQVLANVIGGFAQLTDKIVAATQAGGGLDMAVGVISGAMNMLVRAITLVVDNFEFLINTVRTFIAIKIVLFLGSAAGAMIHFARTVRTLGMTMAAVTALTRTKMTAILLLGAAIAEVTGTTKVLMGWIRDLGATIYDALPESLRDGVDGMTAGLAGLKDEIDGLEGGRTFLELGRQADEAAASVGSIGSAASRTAGQVDIAGNAMERMGQIGQQVTSTLTDGFTNMFMSAIDGSKSLIESIGDLLKSLGRLLINQAFQSLIGGMFGGGGNIMTSLGPRTASFNPGTGWMPSFDGGGFTGLGARTGGLDGKGGFLAMLHPNETVTDHSKGGAAPRDVNFNITVSGARGNAEIRQMVEEGMDSALQTVRSSLPDWAANPRVKFV